MAAAIGSPGEAKSFHHWDQASTATAGAIAALALESRSSNPIHPGWHSPASAWRQPPEPPSR
ncbi:hypothetical protein ASD39_13905 [Sphingomonas sp. Root50]|nr:hypothetical protein ASD17_24105 [Sphingomonas sp. Root1294]KQY66165.1 hypothetical protein ASD39_13905 [Sphingomonas sp. Root50]KRB89670.1 hypothetical protein ASE22_18690 [Sphingomonas sp. Root720]